MSDYISRNAAKQILSRLLVKDAAECSCNLVDCVLPADVAPVRHGQWMHEETEGGFHIGAKMELEDNHEN